MKNNSNKVFLIAIFAFAIIFSGCPSTKVEKKESKDVEYISTPSGLKYVEIIQGSGPSPNIGQTVVVHQIIKTEDGMTIENTYDAKRPFSFKLGSEEILTGLNEGVATMKVGGKRTLYVPPELAFGKRSVRSIPSNSTLVMDVELLEIK